MNDKKLNVTVKVATQNLEGLKQVGQGLDATSEEAKALNAQADELQKALSELGKQQGAIEAFKKLKLETANAAKALEDASQRVEQLGTKLPEAARAAEDLAVAERAAADAVAAARSDLDQKQSALAKLRSEYAGAARSTNEFKTAEAALAADIKAARGGLQDKQAALKAASAATVEAQKAERSLTAEYDKAVGSASQLSTELGKRRQALETARTALKALGLETTGLAETERKLAEAIDAAKGKVAELAPAYKRLADQQRDMQTIGVSSHAAIAKQVEETRAAFDRLKTSGKLTGAELAEAALKAELRVRDLNSQTGTLTETLTRAKGAVIGLAAAGGGLAVVSKAAIDFESAMADVRKVVEGTDAQIAQLGSELKRLSSEEIPLTASGLAKIAAAGGQIGIPIEKISEFTRLAAQMATAFDISAEDAGQSVAKLGNNFELPIARVRALGDAINVLGNTTAAKERDIIEVLTRVGGASKQFGLTAEQAAALAATMLSLGTSSEVVSTGLNAMLSKLQTAAEGSKEFREGLASIGIDARKLARDVREHPQQALIDFLGTLEALDKQTRSEILVKLFGLEYQDDIARLVGSLGSYRESLAKVADESRTAGSMQREFAERAQTTANRLQLLENSLKALAINIGSALLPAIGPVVDGLRDITGAVAEFTEKNPKVTAFIGTLGTAIATMGSLRLAMLAAQSAGALAFGDLAKLSGSLVQPVEAATAAIGKLQVAIAGLGAGVAGWEIGKWAEENFEAVRLYGIGLVQAIFTMAEQVQHRWEQLRAAFTDDTLEEVEKRHQARVSQMVRIFDELKDEATDAARAQRKAAEDAGASAQQSAKDVGNAAHQTSAAVGAIGGAFDAVGAKGAAAGASGKAAMDAVGNASSNANASLLALNKAASDLGLNLAPLGDQLGEGARKAMADFDTLIGGVDTLKRSGIDTAAAVRQAIAGMVARAETQADVTAIRAQLTALAREQRITGADFALALALMRDKSESLRASIENNTPGLVNLRTAANAAGVDLDRMTTGVSAGFRKSVETIEDLITQVKFSGVEASRASPLLEEALDKQLEAAKTKEEVDLLSAAIRMGTDAGLRFGSALDESLKRAQERVKAARTDYAAIFADQARYEKALKESAAYAPGANAGLGSLGGSQDARNATVKSTINSDFSIANKSGTIGSTYTPPPDNSGDYRWVTDDPARPGGYWALTAAGAARRRAADDAQNSAIARAYELAGLSVPGGGAGISPLGLPAAVRERLNKDADGRWTLRDQFAPAPLVAPTSAVAPDAGASAAVGPAASAQGSVDALTRQVASLVVTLQNQAASAGSVKVQEVLLKYPDGRQSLIGVASDSDVRALVSALEIARSRAA